MIIERLVAGDSCRFEILSREMLAAEIIERIRADQPAALCLISLPPGGLRHTRTLCKRLHATFPELRIILARWGSRLRDTQRQSFGELGVSYIGRTPAETREHMISAGRLLKSSPDVPTADAQPVGVAAENLASDNPTDGDRPVS